MIRNELNDSELTTPADYPEILIDDSIDVSRKPRSSTILCESIN